MKSGNSISLRDQFAMAALAGGSERIFGNMDSSEYIASKAYDIADAMMEKRTEGMTMPSRYKKIDKTD